MSTQRRCRVKLVNNIGRKINVEVFRHTNGINDWTERPGILLPGQTWGPRELDYETGIFSNVDHWYVQFTDDIGASFSNDSGFDCSPESEDENKEITVSIEGKLKVTMSDGDSCSESWESPAIISVSSPPPRQREAGSARD
jgi:hypothetical protein